jgi:uracil-DNA glycosylase
LLADLDALRDAARGCTGCELCEPATQTVFGAGPASAWLCAPPSSRRSARQPPRHCSARRSGHREPGAVPEWEGVALVPTVHPSAILRLDPAERDAAFDALVADLQVVAAQHG